VQYPNTPKSTNGVVWFAATVDAAAPERSIRKKYIDLKYGTSKATMPRRMAAAAMEATPRILSQPIVNERERKEKNLKEGRGYE
jgi:hypothetical protein